jgi:hypothetical protein
MVALVAVVARAAAGGPGEVVVTPAAAAPEVSAGAVAGQAAVMGLAAAVLLAAAEAVPEVAVAPLVAAVPEAGEAPEAAARVRTSPTKGQTLLHLQTVVSDRGVFITSHLFHIALSF